ncbi:MAG: flavin monoamine oxidase family protein, partial [Gaiella sp.]
MTSDVRDAVVVGGGIAGLSAAWWLRDRDVVVLEAAERLGGRIRSERRGPYWLNLGAHVFSGPGSATDRLARELGVELVPVPGALVALEIGGKVVMGGRPELYPFRLPFTWRERSALVRRGPKLRRAVARYAALSKPRPGESAAQTRARVLAFNDDATFADWLGPLPGNADALIRATVTRSTAEPEELSAGHGAGYFALVWDSSGGLSRNAIGGSQTLIDAMAAGLEGRVEAGAEVTRVTVEADGLVHVRYGQDGAERELRARRAVVATKAYDATRIAPGLPAATRASLEAIPYGGTVVTALLTTESGPMPWDGLYALATPARSFSMLFNMANVLRPREPVRQPGGSLMVYRSARAADRLMELPAEEIERRFVADLCDIYPEAQGIVGETITLKLPRMLPYVAPGRARLQPALEQS